MSKELKRQPVECWTRICGYLRPTFSWNESKIEEFKSRVVFDYEKSMKE